MMQGIKHKFNPAGNAQLLKNAKEIFLDRVLAEPELRRHIAIAESIGDKGHDLFLARGEQAVSHSAHHPQLSGAHCLQKIIQLLRGGADFATVHTLNAIAEQLEG